MKIIFMGTPEFAVPSLTIMHENYDIVGIFTKVDKPNTRGGKIKYTPVKEYGLKHNIPVFQPESMRSEETYELIKSLNPDLIVVVAYGKIIPNNIIDLPKYGIINVHSSLLPKYRGAAPINAAIVKGEKETGVTIMDIVEELDAGDIIEVGKTPISDEDNFITVHDRLKILGAETLLKAVKKIFSGEAKRVVQDIEKVTFVKPFKKEDCRVDWSKSSRDVFNFVRGMTPFPGVFSNIDGKVLKIIEVKICTGSNYVGKPGEVILQEKHEGFVIKTGDGAVVLTKLKPENKSIISGSDSINGKHLKIGDFLI